MEAKVITCPERAACIAVHGEVPVKTEPRPYQWRGLELSLGRHCFAFPMDMGTGKTKECIDTAAYLFTRGKINAMVIVAPNGVTTQWVDEQVPVHLHDDIPRVGAVWYSQPRKAQREAWERARNPNAKSGPLYILAMHFEAVSTERGKKELWYILEHSRALLVVDESHRMKTPGVKVTKALQAAATRTHKTGGYRRILSGTPFDNSPLDCYSQFKFLHPKILLQTTAAAFRARYAVLKPTCQNCHREVAERTGDCPYCGWPLERHWKKGGGSDGGVIETVVGYQNLDELRERIAPHMFRVRKEDVLKDLPPKTYMRRPVQLSVNQKRMYGELMEEAIAFLPGNWLLEHGTGDVERDIWDLLEDPDVDKIVAKQALSNMIRRRQILGGFLEEAGDLRWEAKPNPRLALLLDILADTDGKVLIWAAFKHEIRMIRDALPEGSAVTYFGEDDAQARVENKRRFIEDPKCRYFVGTAAAGGTGVDGLVVASTVIYYSNTFRAGHRWQSEDRAHRIGQLNPVTIIDLVAPGTLDDVTLESFARKREQQGELLGD
jgi:SNF2 family DNA or RNA helicase